MRELKVDPKFRDFIREMSKQEFEQFENNILSDGEIERPIVVWNGTIIDGHNRWAIYIKHQKEIKMPQIIEKNFSDENEAFIWMCKNQLGQRNLNEQETMYLRGKQYKIEKMLQGAQPGNANAAKNEVDKMSSSFSQKEIAEQDARQQSRREQRDGTAGRIGKEYGVDGRTIRRDEKFANGVDAGEEVVPGFKNAILSGEVKSNKSTIANLRNMEEEERKEAVNRIKTGEPEKPKPNRAKGPQNGSSKEYREIRESVEAIAADMYNADKSVEYTVNDLIEEIRVNAEVYARQLKRTLVIRSTLLSDENKPVVLDAINQHVFQELEKVVSLLK